MKPATFDYVRAKDVNDAIFLLARNADQARLISGGQSLGPMLNLRLVRPSLLIDVGQVSELRHSAIEHDSIRIGAATTHSEIEDGVTPWGKDGILPHVARGIAYRAVRNRGTVGGSLAHADPAADWPLILTTLGASVEVIGSNGRRRIAVEEFITGAFSTSLSDTELVVAVHLPKASTAARWGYWKLCRKAGEFPIASAAVAFFSDRCRAFVGALPGGSRYLKTLSDHLSKNASFDARAFDPSLHLSDLPSEMSRVEQRMYIGCLRKALEQASSA